MYDRFGEMSSYIELNEIAQHLKEENDTEGLLILARENGISEDYADLFAEDIIPYFCDVQIAALGKLNIESNDLKIKGLMKDWVKYIRDMAMKEIDVTLNVRRADKSLKGCFAFLLKYSLANQTEVDEEILKAAKIRAKVTFGVPGQAKTKALIRKYYSNNE